MIDINNKLEFHLLGIKSLDLKCFCNMTDIQNRLCAGLSERTATDVSKNKTMGMTQNISLEY